MINKKIMMIFMISMLFTIPNIFAENDTAELDIKVETDQNLNVDLIEIADKNITNNIICVAGENCNTNLYGGKVNINNESNMNFNQYITNDIDEHHTSGLSLSRLINDLAKGMTYYLDGKNENKATTLWSLLDAMFVSHKEYKPTFNNVMYMAEEIDQLKAENHMLRKYLDLELNQESLECMTGINKAKRTGQKVITENGWLIDLDIHGNMCVQVN